MPAELVGIQMGNSLLLAEQLVTNIQEWRQDCELPKREPQLREHNCVLLSAWST